VLVVGAWDVGERHGHVTVFVPPPIAIWSHLRGLLLSLKSLRNTVDKVASARSYGLKVGMTLWNMQLGDGTRAANRRIRARVNGNSRSPVQPSWRPLGSPLPSHPTSNLVSRRRACHHRATSPRNLNRSRVLKVSVGAHSDVNGPGAPNFMSYPKLNARGQCKAVVFFFQ
jgi:hypothetical protein